MLAAGIWAGATPRSFARFVDFPYHQHFLHDLGAFQIGIGVTLLVALAWRDASAVALTGFLIANTLHAISHANDQDLGGHASDPYAIGALTLLSAAALVVRVPAPHPDAGTRKPAGGAAMMQPAPAPANPADRCTSWALWCLMSQGRQTTPAAGSCALDRRPGGQAGPPGRD
jgi:hypothetical protein